MAFDPLPRAGALAVAASLLTMLACGLGVLALGGLDAYQYAGACPSPVIVGATEYGGPGDPASGTVGSSGVSLLTHPDSYAELGGTSFASADALGRLPYGTPLQITFGDRTVIAYKRDIGLGGGPVGGEPRVIDLWWKLASTLGIPYEHGRWSGVVQIAPAPGVCATAAAASGPQAGGQPASGPQAGEQPAGATPASAAVPRATLLADGQALAPAGAPAAVRGIIAAGNQIVGKPYLYGGGHGLPLNEIAPAYDCSSSVTHLLWGGGLLPASGDMTSGQLEHWGLPGPGRWVTLYARGDHAYMYVAGLRWDTHNAAGPADGSVGLGWHPLVRSSAGFLARHPPGL